MINLAITMVMLSAGYALLSRAHIAIFSQSFENTAGLWSVALVGLAASMSSCLALVGGLLLSITANWSEAHPDARPMRKFLPLLGFNAGRIAGYFVLGGLTGMLGRSLVPSLQATGALKIALSLVMLYLGLKLGNILPESLCRLPGKKKIHTLLHLPRLHTHGAGSVLLGVLTYFVPCGFTQSMQLLALGSGSFLTGGLIMLVFALGTLPALLGISALSSWSHGPLGRLFFTFAAALSILLGVSGIYSGMLLMGINVPTPFAFRTAQQGADPAVSIDTNGQQILSFDVHDAGYSQSNFTIAANRPTWLHANVPAPLAGCIASMAVPSFNILQPLAIGENWIGPVTPTKDFAFMCSMGMFRANVHVQQS